MPKILNILNGDTASEPFRRSNLPGEAVVWREVYTEGPLPCSGSLAEFRKTRAHYLSGIVSQWTEEQILHGLERMDSAVLGLGKGDSLRIWTDACMFDQGMMTRVLFTANRIPAGERPEIELFAEDVVCGEGPEVFSRLAETGKILTSCEVEAGAELWNAFAGGRVPEEIPGVYRFLRDALIRRREELPDRSGFGLTARRVLVLAEKGISPAELFRRVSGMEKHPWLGDSGLWRIADSLAEAGRLRIEDGRGRPVKSLHSADAESIRACRLKTVTPAE